jgi:sugar lactone lactonase YvrE
LDILDERVYWADAKTKTIASVDYNGNDWRTILHYDTNIKSPISLAIFEDKLYWVNGGQKDVFVMNKFNGTEVRKVKLFFFSLSFNSSIYYVLRP